MSKYKGLTGPAKCGCVFLTIALLFTYPLDAASKPIITAKNSASKAEEKPRSLTDIDDITLSNDIGLIKETYKGEDDRLIILIQDAHCNFEAQNNIAKILENFMDEKSLELVGLEGSAGEIDTSLFTTFPDEEIRKEVAAYFMKKGKISGAEYLAINTKKPVLLYGIENKEYYLENLKAFTDSLESRQTAKKFCQDIGAYLNKLKRYVYTKELKDLDSTIEDYNRDKIKFVEFCKYLAKLAEKKKVDLGNFINFSHLIAALEAEKGVDFKKVDNERSTIIGELEKKLLQEDLSELFLTSLSYKTKKISASEYYNYLKGVSADAGVELAKFKNFSLYADYLTAYGKINNSLLFKELGDLQEAIKETLYANDDQRALGKLSKNIKIMKDLFDISLSKDEAAYFMANKADFNSGAFIGFIERQASRYGLAVSVNIDTSLIDDMLPTLENFYHVAEKREEALFENTLNKMDEKGQKVSALISGGFHTEGLTRRFKEKGISYVVIAPRITDLDAESPYLEVLSGGKIKGEKTNSAEKDER